MIEQSKVRVELVAGLTVVQAACNTQLNGLRLLPSFVLFHHR
jgi:hypothetical protein